jgi:hypothetical protein
MFCPSERRHALQQLAHESYSGPRHDMSCGAGLQDAIGFYRLNKGNGETFQGEQ